MTFERIAIMGAGSMGIVLGVYIAQQRQVDLIVGSKTSADALNTNGARVVGNIEMTVPVHAVRSEDMEGIYDLFLYMAKQNGTIHADESCEERFRAKLAEIEQYMEA